MRHVLGSAAARVRSGFSGLREAAVGDGAARCAAAAEKCWPRGTSIGTWRQARTVSSPGEQPDQGDGGVESGGRPERAHPAQRAERPERPTTTPPTTAAGRGHHLQGHGRACEGSRTDGEHDRGGGVIWRAKDENNYYVCRMNPLETNFRAYKVVDGKRKQLGSAEVKTESGKWYDLRVVMVGDHIQCYLAGERLLEVRDDQFKDAGVVGLWTKADASSSFDDFT